MILYHMEVSNTLQTAMGNPFCKAAQVWLDPELQLHHTSESQATIHLTLGIIQTRCKPPLIPLVTACLKEEGCWGAR